MTNAKVRMYNDPLRGRDEILRFLGKRNQAMQPLVESGLRAWRSGPCGSWRCFQKDAHEYLMMERDEELKQAV